MQIREVSIRDESIRLGQFLKLAGLAEDGGQAKALIETDDVTVNGRVEVRRGRQLAVGDVVAVGGEKVRLVSGG
jgi:ribosome-associated protein